MKKFFAQMLCLALMLSLTACGGQESTSDKGPASSGQSTSGSQQVQTGEEPLFDNSWASHDFEKMIPEPPFAGWVGEVQNSNLYFMTCQDAVWDTWTVYAKYLTRCGYTVEAVEHGFIAWDEAGNYIELPCRGSTAMIIIQTAEAKA